MIVGIKTFSSLKVTLEPGETKLLYSAFSGYCQEIPKDAILETLERQLKSSAEKREGVQLELFEPEIKTFIERLMRHPVSSYTDAFCFVLAHELVHAFRYMRVVVPAFLDWRTFQREAERYGDLILNLADDHQRFVDQYGEENELLELKDFWPDELAE